MSHVAKGGEGIETAGGEGTVTGAATVGSSGGVSSRKQKSVLLFICLRVLRPVYNLGSFTN